MSRFKKVSIAGAVVALVLVFVGIERAWFAGEPAWRGKTVTEWLDRLVLYEYQTNATCCISLFPRSPEAVARDPALAALRKLGSKATPVLLERLAGAGAVGPGGR